LVDAPIFVYHFTGASPACRAFLERCEAGEIRASTSAVAVAEMTHRMMTIEAVAHGRVEPGDVVRKLRRNPQLVRELDRYDRQAEQIPLMGVDVLPLDLPTLLAAGDLRRRYGLLVNDSLIAATALASGCATVATSDRDFERVSELTVAAPGDL
jgi:predicted nucleic acid-binding protein